MPTKADFAAVREQMGFTKRSFAAWAGVRERTVCRWENPADEIPSAKAWAALYEAYDLHQQAVSREVERAVEADADGLPVKLAYWPCQYEYDACRPDEPMPFGVANANARAAAARLRDLGISVTFAWGSGSAYATATEGF